MPEGALEVAADALAASPEGGDLMQAWTLSTKRVDSYRDTVDPDGWALEDYARNPVVLFAHKADALPVGRDMGAWIEKGVALKGVTRFTAPDLYAFGATVGKLVAAGVLNATSVGFEPLEFEPSEERSTEDSWLPAFDFKRQALREYSIVPVPANMDALADGRAKGVDLSPIVSWAEEILDGAGSLFVPRSTLESVRRAALGGSPISVRVAQGVDLVVAKADAEAESPNLNVPTDAETPSSSSNGTTQALDNKAPCTCPACAWTGTVGAALEESTIPRTHALCPECKFEGTFEEWAIETPAAEPEPADVKGAAEERADHVDEAAAEAEAVTPLEVGDRVVVVNGHEVDGSHVGIGAVVEDLGNASALVLFDGATEAVEYPLEALALEGPPEEPEEKAFEEPAAEGETEIEISAEMACACPQCGYEGGLADFAAPTAPTLEEEGGGDAATKDGQTLNEFENLAARVALVTVREVRRQVTERTGALP